MKLSLILILSILVSGTAWAEYDMPPDLQPDTDRNPMMAYQDPNPFGFGLENIQMDGDHGHDHGQIEEETKAPEGPRVPWLRLSAMGGIGQLSTGPLNDSIKGWFAGVNADITIKRYFGLEIDGFYGGAENSSAVDGMLTSTRQWGLSGLAKLQVGLALGRFKLTPRLLGGYGAVSVSEDFTAPLSGSPTSSGANQTDTTVHGILWGYGAELEGFGNLVLTFDLVKSLGQSSEIEQGFDRLRIGAYYRVTPSLLMGVQYQSRNIASGSDFKSLSQFTGSVGLEF
jgi:hypothetical protein